jgi:hypothetical protein
MDKSKTIYTAEQMKKTEELAMILAKNNSAKSKHEFMVTLGCAFISGLEAGLQLSKQKFETGLQLSPKKRGR